MTYSERIRLLEICIVNLQQPVFIRRGLHDQKTLGILGGMGPLATVDLMTKIIALTPAQKDQDHIHMIVDNYPQIPDRTEAILGKGTSPYLL